MPCKLGAHAFFCIAGGFPGLRQLSCWGSFPGREMVESAVSPGPCLQSQQVCASNHSLSLQCSVTCGEGTEVRQVICRAADHCDGAKPESVRPCQLPPCNGTCAVPAFQCSGHVVTLPKAQSNCSSSCRIYIRYQEIGSGKCPLRTTLVGFFQNTLGQRPRAFSCQPSPPVRQWCVEG